MLYFELPLIMALDQEKMSLEIKKCQNWQIFNLANCAGQIKPLPWGRKKVPILAEI